MNSRVEGLHLALSLTALSVLLSSCGNAVFTDVQGRVGFSVAEGGQIRVEIQTCQVEIDRISLSTSASDNEQVSEQISEWRSEEAISGRFTLIPNESQSPWELFDSHPVSQDPNSPIKVNGVSAEKDTSVGLVAVSLGNVQALGEGEIITGFELEGTDGRIEVLSEEEFSRCE